MILKIFNQLLHVLLVVCPIVFELLNLRLCITKTLVELLDILIWLKQFIAIGYLLQIHGYFLIELLSLLHQNPLNCKKIPIAPNGLEQTVEEFIKIVSKSFFDLYNMVSKLDLIVCDASLKHVVYLLLSLFDFVESLTNLPLE